MSESSEQGSDLKSKLEKMLKTEIEEIDEEQEVIKIHVPEDKIGRAIGFRGSNIRAAEEVIGKKIEVVKE